jgi:hypothetical protein
LHQINIKKHFRVNRLLETSNKKDSKKMAPPKATTGCLLFNQLILPMEHISTALVEAASLMNVGVKNPPPTNSAAAAEEIQIKNG